MIAKIEIDLQKWVGVEGRLLENEKSGIFDLIVENLVHYGVPPKCSQVRTYFNMNMHTWEQIGRDLCAAFLLEEDADGKTDG